MSKNNKLGSNIGFRKELGRREEFTAKQITKKAQSEANQPMTEEDFVRLISALSYFTRSSTEKSEAEKKSIEKMSPQEKAVIKDLEGKIAARKKAGEAITRRDIFNALLPLAAYLLSGKFVGKAEEYASSTPETSFEEEPFLMENFSSLISAIKEAPLSGYFKYAVLGALAVINPGAAVALGVIDNLPMARAEEERVYPNMLMSSVEEGNLPRINEIFKQHSSPPYYFNKNGESLLYIALHQGREDIFKVLANARYSFDPHTNPTFATHKKDGILHVAIRENKNTFAKILIERTHRSAFIDLDYIDLTGVTAFDLAVQKGNVEIAALLLRKDKINSLSSKGTLPLVAAVNSGNQEMVSLLIQKGAKINLAQKDGKTSLLAAIENGDTRMVEFLVQNKVNLNPEKGKSPLALAAEKGNSELIKLLLEKKVNPDLVKDKNSALVVAVVQEDFEKVAALREEGAELDKAVLDGSKLSEVFSRKIFDVIEKEDPQEIDRWKNLFAIGADLKNENGDNILARAVQRRGFDYRGGEICHYLLSNFAEKIPFHSKNRQGKTALDLVREYYPPGLRPTFFEKEQEVLLKSFIEAVRSNKAEVVEEFFRHGELRGNANAQITGASGGIGNVEFTPLHLAAANGNEKIVKMLLESGADFDVKNNREKSALDLAKENGHEKIVEILQEKYQEREEIQRREAEARERQAMLEERARTRLREEQEMRTRLEEQDNQRSWWSSTGVWTGLGTIGAMGASIYATLAYKKNLLLRRNEIERLGIERTDIGGICFFHGITDLVDDFVALKSHSEQEILERIEKVYSVFDVIGRGLISDASHEQLRAGERDERLEFLTNHCLDNFSNEDQKHAYEKLYLMTHWVYYNKLIPPGNEADVPGTAGRRAADRAVVGPRGRMINQNEVYGVNPFTVGSESGINEKKLLLEIRNVLKELIEKEKSSLIQKYSKFSALTEEKAAEHLEKHSKEILKKAIESYASQEGGAALEPSTRLRRRAAPEQLRGSSSREGGREGN